MTEQDLVTLTMRIVMMHPAQLRPWLWLLLSSTTPRRLAVDMTLPLVADLQTLAQLSPMVAELVAEMRDHTDRLQSALTNDPPDQPELPEQPEPAPTDEAE